MDHLLDVQGMRVTYHTHMGPLQALYDIDFHIDPGEIVGIVGESGCGKSTIASALLRLLPPNGEITAGKILFKGQDQLKLDREALRKMRGRDIAMIFQDPMTSLNPVFTVGSQMMDVQKAHLSGKKTRHRVLRRQAIEMLTRVGIPDASDRIDNYPHQFSGGMRQRIMIAMALMSEPALLIADEPTSALDVTLEAQILELIKELRDSYGTAVLFISHDLGVIAQLCDRVIIMYAGSVVEHGDVHSIYASPQHPYTRMLLAAIPSQKHRGERLATIPGRVPSLSALPPGCKFADRCPWKQPICKEEEPRYLELNGRQVRCHMYSPKSEFAGKELPVFPSQENLKETTVPGGFDAELDIPTRQKSEGLEPEHVIRLENLSTFFTDNQNLVEKVLGRSIGAVHAVDGVDLTIKDGEVVGLVGESGSGKTTVGKTILRLVSATDGKIYYSDQDVAAKNRADFRRLRRQMQMIFQDPYSSLSPRLTVSYLLREPYIIHKMPKPERRSVTELLEMVGLSDEQASKYPHELSGGQARRVGIARALALQPRFLIADEPTSGLDVSAAAAVLNLMKDLAGKLGLTYLIITHNLNLVAYISTKVVVMYLGKFVEMGPTQQVLESPKHPYTQALLAANAEPDPTRRRGRQRLLLVGEIPSPKNPPKGCRFHTRCPFIREKCSIDEPSMELAGFDHSTACHYWQDIVNEEVE
jgi:peptide/nickel transport system ATP-binding protein